VIGRVAECDLTLNSRKASRRHAEVRYEGEQVLIEDLGSTNGTFVNGERLRRPRVLQPGDRIHIGGSTITFCHVNAQLAPSVAGDGDDPAATVQFKEPPLAAARDEAFRGNLSQVPASAVLQVLSMAGKTGAIGIITGEGSMRIWLEDGRLVHAETAGAEGLDAALVIAQVTEGRFLFDAGHPAPARTIHLTVAELLLEASRRLDESLQIFPALQE